MLKLLVREHFMNVVILKRLVIPNTVAYVDSFAFAYCLDLEYIRYPEGIKTLKYCTLFGCIYNHRTTKTNQKYPSVNL